MEDVLKDCRLIRVIVSTLREYDAAHKREIDSLQNHIGGLYKERSLIIKNLEAGNIQLLKDYFNIK